MCNLNIYSCLGRILPQSLDILDQAEQDPIKNQDQGLIETLANMYMYFQLIYDN